MLFKHWTGRWRQRYRRIPALCTPQLPSRRDGLGQCARPREWTRMIAMLTLLRCDGFSVSTLLPKPGTDRGSGDRLVEEAGPAPVARRRIGNRFPPPPLFLHEPGRFEGTQAETSRLGGCRQTLDVERVRPQTTRRQSVTETPSNGFDSRLSANGYPRVEGARRRPAQRNDSRGMTGGWRHRDSSGCRCPCSEDRWVLVPWVVVVHLPRLSCVCRGPVDVRVSWVRGRSGFRGHVDALRSRAAPPGTGRTVGGDGRRTQS